MMFEFTPLFIFLSVVAALVVIFFITFIAKSVYLVSQAEAIIIERFGRFHKILYPGIHIIVPFVDVPRRVFWTYIVSDINSNYSRYYHQSNVIDLRESVYDFPKQNVITRDNVTMEINALLYYQITDPKAAVYEVVNLPEAIEKLTQTTLRNVIGSMDLDESLVSRDQINERLRIILDEATDKWGVKVNRVELQEVNPPKDIRIAMEKQMRAERDRRATILEAEGEKGAAILKAQGVRESDVLRAEGEGRAQIIAAECEAESRIKIAEGEAKAMELIKAASGNKELMAYLVATNYIKTLPKMMDGKDNKLIVVPYEASSLTGAVATIKSLFEKAN